MSISSIGYKAQMIPVEVRHDRQLSPVVLEPDNVMLNEITVEASSFVRQKEKLLIYPDKKQVKHSATGYDLLYRAMIPEVDVDRMEGKVSTLGGEATLYIDGRKVDSREIRNLQPKEIEKIEYYDVPVGKYMNDVVAINFITKKYKAGGYVSLNGEQRIGYLSGNYNAVAKLSHKNTSYTLFGGYAMNRYDGTKSDTQEQFVFPDHQTDRQSATLESKVKNNNQYAQLNIANQNEKRSLAGKISLVRNDAPNNYNRDMLEYGNGDKRQESFRNTDQTGWKSGMELYGNFQLNDKQFFETTLRGNYTNNAYAYAYRENTYSTLTESKEDLYDLSIIMNYGVQFSNQNSLTVQGYHFQTISSVAYQGTTSSWQHFWEGESLLFLEYNQKFGKKTSLRFGPGLSYVQYRLHGDDRKDKLSPRLHFNLIYRPNRHRMFLSQLSGAWKATDNLRIKLVGGWQYVAYKGTPERLKQFSGNMQVDYYWHDFSCGVFCKSSTKWLNFNLMYGTQPAQYGGYASWSRRNWHIEGGVKNPFSKHNKEELVMDRGVYRYQNSSISKLNQQSGYIKVVYTVDFGKKTSRDYNDVDTSINSSILKAN